MDFAAYFFNRNGETLIVWQDLLFQNDFPCLFFPKKKENWVRCSVAFATEEDLEAVKEERIEILTQKPMGSEFFYRTEDFLHPKGAFKNRVNQFKSHQAYTLTHACDKARIREFYDFWKSQREHEGLSFEESEIFFPFCLEHLEKYGIEQVYVEVDQKLVGFAWGVRFPGSNNWVGLHLKVDYRYKGLSRFLHQERAKMFEDCQEFSLGTGAQDKGIETYKEELGPAYKKAYFYVLTGDKKE